MEAQTKVIFKWNNYTYFGIIEREYENSVLVQVNEPSAEMMEKYNGRMVISKKICESVNQ
ncbi:DUF2187 domain-containing protein [Enterococcus lemanii]|uniref:DUF2187 domain-containing protein n=1 Tax=Enterococcus lemanii TaxID=1159752 RepID=A0ABV9MWV5_9ENTE|nr:DUF2187 domain-containing protein [Enterococcus lemanii]MBM7707978.1 hypothetical protein [Enterococcus lemanii]NLM66361.1 DUF2187 domain-containing protein [Enterococcus sp.]